MESSFFSCTFFGCLLAGKQHYLNPPAKHLSVGKLIKEHLQHPKPTCSFIALQILEGTSQDYLFKTER